MTDARPVTWRASERSACGVWAYSGALVTAEDLLGAGVSAVRAVPGDLAGVGACVACAVACVACWHIDLGVAA